MGHDPHNLLRSYIAANNLKSSRQRELIAEVFFKAGGHLRVDELLEKVRHEDPRVSQATVYRTMKLLTECGLAEARNFDDGHTRYELADTGGAHHDHLICERCGKIVEFFDEKLERMQERVAKQHGFRVARHKMELYGLCRACGGRTKEA